jgi:hypothetical protein
MGWVVSVTTRPRFTPGERIPGTRWRGGWVGLRAGLDTRGQILCLYQGSKPSRPVCSQTLHPSSLTAGTLFSRKRLSYGTWGLDKDVRHLHFTEAPITFYWYLTAVYLKKLSVAQITGSSSKTNHGLGRKCVAYAQAPLRDFRGTAGKYKNPVTTAAPHAEIINRSWCLGLQGFWTLSIPWYSKKSRRFGNCTCFRNQVSTHTHTHVPNFYSKFSYYL